MIKQQGFSLIELMIAMGLSLVLLMGVLEVFNRHKQSFELIHGLSDLQENGRVSVALIAESLRMADHWAGVHSDRVEFGNTLLTSSTGGCNAAWVFNSAEAVRGYEGASTINSVNDFPAACIDQSDYVEKSDLLMLRYADGRTLSRDDEISSNRNAKQHFVRVTTGLEAYVFNGNNSPLALSKIPSLGNTYNMAYRAELYFLRPCSNKVSGRCRDGLPTLVRLALSGNRLTQQALVEGVEQLQFSYGVDQNEDKEVDRYQTASAVTDWDDVISVRLSLIVRGFKKDIGLDESGKEYLMEGDMGDVGSGYVVGQADKQFRRKLYQREVYIRNRGRS
jgi:prepilin-type N-terminal cleavage/methylation domain-containing protein